MIDLPVGASFNATHVVVLGHTLLLGLEPQCLQFLLDCLTMVLSFTALAKQIVALLMQVLDLRLALRQQQLEVGQSCLSGLAPRQRLRRLLAELRRILTRSVLNHRQPFPLG